MKLAVCIPTAGNPKWQFTANLVQHACTAARSLGWDDVNLFMRPGLLPMVREVLFAEAAIWGADRILWLDDDMSTEPNPQFGNLAPLAGLMEVMDANEKCGHVGAIYARQTPRLLTTAIWHPSYVTDRGKAQAAVVQDIPSRPFQCAWVGAGYSLMRVAAAREIIEKHGSPLWNTPLLTFPDGRPRAYVTDDCDLCLKMHETGWEVWADPRPITTHYKDAGPIKYEYGEWEKTPKDFRPLNKDTCALFRDEATGILALDMYTPKLTRAQPGYAFMEMALERK